MRKTTLIAFGGASVGVALAILYILISTPRRSLDRFLKEVATVEVGKTRFEDWRKKVERDRISSVFLRGDRVIAWSGENKLLWKLRLAPRTVVDASVGFKDGTADEIYVILEIERRDDKRVWYPCTDVVVRQSMDRASDCDAHYNLLRKREGAGVKMGRLAQNEPSSAI